MILIIDNYDSFVFNLARYVSELGHYYQVVRNDKIDCGSIETINPTHIILSPGPCTPNEAGICMDAIKHWGSTIPILGICLGHQAIAQAYGGNIVRANSPCHGKSAKIRHDEKGIFTGLPNPLVVGRYHSLVAEAQSLPTALRISAQLDDQTIMAIQHESHPVVGLQFHPESVLTECGHELIKQFIEQFS